MHERPYQAEEGSLDRHSPSTTTPSSPAPSEDSSSSKESASAHSTNHDEYADSCPYTVEFVATALGHEPPDPFDPEFTGDYSSEKLADLRTKSQTELCMSYPPLPGRTVSDQTTTLSITSIIRTGPRTGAQLVVVNNNTVAKIYDPL